jgi:hypothetical protein
LRRDLACAALGLALAAAYWMAAQALPTSFLADAVGADGVPKALAGVLAVLSLVIALRALQQRAESAARKNHGRALFIAILGFGYLLVIPYAGYLVSVALLAALAALHYGAPRRPGVALFGVGTAVLLWLVFGALLGIALP